MTTRPPARNQKLSPETQDRRQRPRNQARLARDPTCLAPSLEEFVGHPAYGIPQLRQDLERFVFLLGGSDGEPLFSLPPP